MTIPMRGTDTVRTAPLPGVRVPTGVPEEAFGTATTLDLSGLQKNIAQITERETQKANDTALLAADNELARLQADLHVKAQQLKGRDALSAHETVGAEWAKSTGEIAKNLKLNDQQLRLFQDRVGQRGNQLYTFVAQHTERESEAYQEQTFEAGLKNRQNDAAEHYTDPSVVAASLTETKSLIARWGQHQGWAPETVAATTAKYVSQVHTGIIDRMLANGNDLAATTYYRRAQSEILGTEQGTVEKALDVGSTRGISMREGDTIMKTTVSMDAALSSIATRAQDPADAMFNPTVREWTEERVRRLYQDKRQAITMKHELAYDSATQIITRTKDFSQIPPRLLMDLSPTEITQLRREEHLLRHPEKITDEDTYYSLMNLAGMNDAARITFMNLRLSDYRGKLADRDWHQLVGLQLQIRRESGRLSASEEKADTKKQEKAALRSQAQEQVRQLMGGQGSVAPRVPGAPLQRGPSTKALPTPPLATPPNAPIEPANPRNVQVPRSWIERAKRDTTYRKYLEHMGAKVQ